MRSGLGSETFETNVMNTADCFLAVKAMKEAGHSNEIILNDLHLLDDLLSLQSMRVYTNVPALRYTAKGRLRKDSTLSAMIEARIDKYVEASA